MTDAQWQASTSPEEMLHFLTSTASGRKLRLYAIGCCRRIWHLLTDDRCRYAVEVAQRVVDGRDGPAELAAAGLTVASVARLTQHPYTGLTYPRYSIGGAAWAVTRPSPWDAAWDAALEARVAARDFVRGTDWERERAWQADLLHDLFGNPFAAFTVDPAWLATAEGAVGKLARVIYAEDRFGDLPYLADALEEAGCDRTDVLAHCRDRRPHYRGCWVVDAVLGFH
ncbi:MAG: hypothetical protein U0736_24220 [Gemmataceae bacterium]